MSAAPDADAPGTSEAKGAAVPQGPVLVIIGGLGPRASVRFEEILLDELDLGESASDQDYPPVIHVSIPGMIADRNK